MQISQNLFQSQNVDEAALNLSLFYVLNIQKLRGCF